MQMENLQNLESLKVCLQPSCNSAEGLGSAVAGSQAMKGRVSGSSPECITLWAAAPTQFPAKA